MNRMVISGTARTTSMKAVLSHLTTGSELRRPTASATPMGNESTMLDDREHDRQQQTAPHGGRHRGQRRGFAEAIEQHEDEHQRDQPADHEPAPRDRPTARPASIRPTTSAALATSASGRPRPQAGDEDQQRDGQLAGGQHDGHDAHRAAAPTCRPRGPVSTDSTIIVTHTRQISSWRVADPPGRAACSSVMTPQRASKMAHCRMSQRDHHDDGADDDGGDAAGLAVEEVVTSASRATPTSVLGGWISIFGCSDVVIC